MSPNSTGLASLSHFVWNIALTEAGPSAFANIHENYYCEQSSIRLKSVLIIINQTRNDRRLCWNYVLLDYMRVLVLPGDEREDVRDDCGRVR